MNPGKKDDPGRVGQVWSGLLLAPLEKGDLFMGKRIEYKFTPVDNKMLEALIKRKLPGRTLRVFLAILRQTNGFQRTEDKIMWKRYSNMTGLSKSHLSDQKSMLIKSGMIYEKDGEMGVITDFSKWKEFPSTGTLKSTRKGERKVPVKGNKRFPSTGNTKEPPKDSIKEKVLSKPKEGERKERLIESVQSMIESIGNMPGMKKTNTHLIKRNQKQEK